MKDRKLRVNAVSPAPTNTSGWQTEEERKQFREHEKASVPLGRIADPDEIAKVIVFLASDESSFVNGIKLCADGGQAQI